MNKDYRGILNLTYEIEGLLLLLDSRKDENCEKIEALLAEKAARLQEALAHEAEPEAAPEEIAEAAEFEEKSDAEPEAPTAGEPEPEPIAEPEPVAEPEVAPQPTVAETVATPEKLDEKLSRQRARDIFKAFTLNDKFRFRHELFRNSQEEFDDTLNVISEMSNFEEAEEYFFDDLCWNPESQDVKDFMTVVKNHF